MPIWKSSDTFPADGGFFWVKRKSSDEAQLAYYAWDCKRFESVDSALERESDTYLPEHYDDVTYWTDLTPPATDGI